MEAACAVSWISEPAMFDRTRQRGLCSNKRTFHGECAANAVRPVLRKYPSEGHRLWANELGVTHRPSRTHRRGSDGAAR
jgi:hypothetical protein